MSLHFLTTDRYFGTLAADLGCFPLDDGSYHSSTDCRGNGIRGIRSLTGFGIRLRTLSLSVLYLLGVLTRR